MEDLFFNLDDDEEDDDAVPISKMNAMKLFKLQDDRSYHVTIKNAMRFDLAIQHVSIGLSFCQTAKVIEQHRAAARNAKLSGVNDHMVSQLICVLVAFNLQTMFNVLNDLDVWAFSLAIDASTHRGVHLLDQRIWLCVKGKLFNLNLVLFPFFERHTAQNYVKLIDVLLSTVCPTWQDKFISISLDGKNTMTGCHARIVTLLERQCSNSVLRVWCIHHQLDIVVKKATQVVFEGEF